MRHYNVLVALLLFVAAEKYASAAWNFPNFQGAGGFHSRRNSPFNLGQGSSKVGIFGWIFGQSPQRSSGAGLKEGFYRTTCPNAETIVRNTVQTHFKRDPTIAAGIIRLFFHDCFVGGCDASILLDKTPSGELAEKLAFANGFTLHGLEALDDAKTALEAACPGIVSCADVLSFAARDAVVLSGLQTFPMVAGRRDVTGSRASEVTANLPDPLATVDKMNSIFNQKGFSLEEMVVLLGAHSIGGAHCFTFTNRLYQVTDPALDAKRAQQLKNTCPARGPGADVSKDAKVNFDPTSPLLLDPSYYTRLLNGGSLLTSDHLLVTDGRTKQIIAKMAANPENWKKQFTLAMVKLSKLDVLEGNQGEIRQKCRAVNGGSSQQFPRFPFFSGRGF